MAIQRSWLIVLSWRPNRVALCQCGREARKISSFIQPESGFLETTIHFFLVPASFYSAAKQLNVLQSHGRHGGLTLNRRCQIDRAFQPRPKAAAVIKVRP